MSWTETERRIFEYHDGAQKVYGDPLEINMRLSLTLPDADEVRRKINESDKPGLSPEEVYAAWAAHEKLCLAVREAFQMVEFDRTTGKGATSAQCIAVWNMFSRFMQKKNPSGDTLPTSPPSMESFPPVLTTPPTSV